MDRTATLPVSVRDNLSRMPARSRLVQVARVGWPLGAVIGALVALALLVVSALRDPTVETGEIVVTVMFALPIGAAPGAAIGGLMALVARRMRTPQPTVVEQAAEEPEPDDEPKLDLTTTPPTELWGLRDETFAGYYQRCWRSTLQIRDLTDTLAGGPAQDWMRDILADLERELHEVLRLARYGSILAGGHSSDEPTLQRISDMLIEAEEAFVASARRASSIAVDLAAGYDLTGIRAQLDVLAKQAPHLRDLPASDV